MARYALIFSYRVMLLLFPPVLVESAKISACFSEFGIDFIINDVSKKCAAKVGELIHAFCLCPLLGLSWGWLVHDFNLRCTDCKAKVVASLGKLVNAVLHLESNHRQTGSY